MVYTVRQATFEGPLGLLLELIQAERLSINEIALAKVTDEFVRYLRELETDGGTSQDVLAEFLVIAAQLLLIKSRSLLPQLPAGSEEEQSVHELKSRLAEYQRIQEVALELGRMAAGGQKSFSREAFANRERGFYPPRRLTATMLAQALQAVIALIPKAGKLAEERIRKIISLEDKIRELHSLLALKMERAFSEIVSGARERVEVIVSFLALLELAKQKLVTIHQPQPFGEITIRRAPENS